LIFSSYSIIDHQSFLKQGEYRERRLILLPASASEHARLFKDVPKLDFSLRIKAAAIWKYRFKIEYIALGLLAGSTYFLLWSLIEVIPTHIFFLKFFEELELKLRFGKSYIEYKERVPFLIPQIRRSSRNKYANNNA